MKATGEVMAIDRSFEAALQKAVRSLEWDDRDLGWEEQTWSGPQGADILDDLVRRPNDQRLWALMAALRRGITAETIAADTGIDPWFTAPPRRHCADGRAADARDADRRTALGGEADGLRRCAGWRD